MLKNTFNLRGIAFILCGLLGVAIQIQATIGESKESFGLRVNLADIALPVMAGLVLFSLLLKKSIWPQWNNVLGIFWPIAMTALMIFAFWNGQNLTGEWSQWAFINKFIGWFILMGYFGFGAWAATNIGHPAIRIFLQTFIITFTTIAVIQSAILILGDLGVFGTPFLQLKGLMGNRNAMGLVILMAFTVLSVYTLANRPLIPQWALSVFLAALPLFLILCGSRATWIAFIIPIIGLIFVFGLRTIKYLRITAVSALIIIPALLLVNGERGVFRELQNKSITELGYTAVTTPPNIASNTLSNTGDRQRLRVFNDAITFWKDSPVTGIGLGSFVTWQSEKYKDSPQLVLGVIDSSPLWILTETGLIGAMLFFAFSVAVLHALWRNRKPTGQGLPASDANLLRICMIFIILSFGFMSLFHELIYTRIIWLMLGMALAVSRDESERVRADV